jgi:alpha-glucosidase (family GH31 glycosyl hydrolase)
MSQIIHTPFGQEHPYIQGPEERIPRQPLAGELFTVSIVTRPPGAVQRVQVHTELDGQPGPTVDAVLYPDWKPELEAAVGMDLLGTIVRVEQDVWRATFRAPAVGETLRYWIEADGSRSEVYTLVGEAWTTGARRAASYLEMESGLRELTVNPAGQLKHMPPTLSRVEWLSDGTQSRRVRLTFACRAGEAFFGLGERFNALNQRGQILDIRCYEQYKNQGKRTYMPVPFLLSSAGYAVYVESSRWMQFDLASSQSDSWTLEADLGPDETLRLIWMEDSDPLKLIENFTTCTGRPVLPPLWSFGLWMSGNEWNSQTRVMKEVEASFEHGIEPSVVVIEAWSDEATFYIWNEAQYTPTAGGGALHYNDLSFPPGSKWPNPQAMLDELHRRDIRLVLWQIPAMKVLDEPHAQHDADRAYFEQQGFGVRQPDGSLYRIRPPWFRGGYLWDPTNPAAREWWFAKRAYLLEMGVDGFKTDGGEHMWGTQTVFASGQKGEELWNEYPKQYTEAYYKFVSQNNGLVFSRAGFTGSQAAPAHWAGDENSTWDAYRHSIIAGLSAGISGISFWGWDIAGFSGEIPSAELYLRGTAMAAFCPIMQYHSEYNAHREPCRDRTPWNMQARTGDERVIPYFRQFVNIRRNLMPYIWQEAQHSAHTGHPMMRALALWETKASPYHYFFGRDLLVCPVIEEGAQTWPVYLPEGDWVDLLTREAYSGGQTISIAAPLDRIPVFVRRGTQIPVRLGESGVLGEPVELSAEANQILTF